MAGRSFYGLPKVGDPGVTVMVVEGFEEEPPRVTPMMIPVTAPATAAISTIFQVRDLSPRGFSSETVAALIALVCVMLSCPVRFRMVAVTLIVKRPVVMLGVNGAPA